MSELPKSESTDEQDRLSMERLVAGKDFALNELMDRYGAKLFHFLIRALQNESDAEDLAQETFVRIFENRARFDPRKKFSTWLYAIASNLVKDRFRYRARHPNVSLNEEMDNEGSDLQQAIPGNYPSPAAIAEQKEIDLRAKIAIGSLPEELRMPLILSVFEERSHQEIGEILDCSAKAVETRIYRARRILREKLTDYEVDRPV